MMMLLALRTCLSAYAPLSSGLHCISTASGMLPHGARARVLNAFQGCGSRLSRLLLSSRISSSCLQQQAQTAGDGSPSSELSAGSIRTRRRGLAAERGARSAARLLRQENRWHSYSYSYSCARSNPGRGRRGGAAGGRAPGPLGPSPPECGNCVSCASVAVLTVHSAHKVPWTFAVPSSTKK